MPKVFPFAGCLQRYLNDRVLGKKTHTFKHYVKQGLMSRVSRYLSLISFTADNFLASSEQTTAHSRVLPHVTFLAYLKADLNFSAR